MQRLFGCLCVLDACARVSSHPGMFFNRTFLERIDSTEKTKLASTPSINDGIIVGRFPSLLDLAVTSRYMSLEQAHIAHVHLHNAYGTAATMVSFVERV